MEFVGTFWALVPPIVAIVLALITKETYTSLFVGIVVGALLLAGFDPINTINYIIVGEIGEGEDAMAVGFLNAISDPWNAGIFVFLVMLGIMVALVNKAGGSAAFGAWAAKHIKTRVGAQLATFALGVLIFIDDYFNCLTVGAVMRPVTDEQKISRAKLSYIIDATAAPICMIAPISSWAAAVSATAADLDSGVTGIQLFIQAIPYNFYSLLTIVFIIVIVVMGFDYGPMARAEIEAYRDGVLGSLGNEEKLDNPRAKLIDMLIPIIVLIVFCIIGMMFVGGFWDSEAEGYGDLALAFGNTDASVGLPWGSIIALVFTFIYLLCRRVISFGDAAVCIVDGFRAMVPALLILTFALTLKLATTALGADVFVAGLMEGAAAGLYSMLPAIIFLVALGLAFATGTSWGTSASSSRSSCRFSRPSPSCSPLASLPAWLVRSAAITARPFRRYDDHGLGRREREPHSPRADAAALRAHGGDRLVRVLRHRRLRAKLDYLPRHRHCPRGCRALSSCARPSASASRNETVARSNCLIVRVREGWHD